MLSVRSVKAGLREEVSATRTRRFGFKMLAGNRSTSGHPARRCVAYLRAGRDNWA